MTKEELAIRLDGRQYEQELEDRDCILARENGLVVVYGYSDDKAEFEGAISDEVDETDFYENNIIYLNENGVFESECEDEDCPYAAREMEKCKTIHAVWRDKGPYWTYETDIPHAKFNIYEDGDVYCVGIVFELAALKQR